MKQWSHIETTLIETVKKPNYNREAKLKPPKLKQLTQIQTEPKTQPKRKHRRSHIETERELKQKTQNSEAKLKQ